MKRKAISIGRDYYIPEDRVSPYMKKWLASRGHNKTFYVKDKTTVRKHKRRTERGKVTTVKKHKRKVTRVVKKRQPRIIFKKPVEKKVRIPIYKRKQLTILVDIPKKGEIKPFITKKQRYKIINEHLKSKGKKPLTKKEMRRTHRKPTIRTKLSGIEIKNLKTIPKRKFGIENDLIPIDSLIDFTLDYGENERIIEEYVEKIATKKEKVYKPIEPQASAYVDNLVYKVSSGENGDITEELKRLATRGMVK